jgi:hypothetical protein
VKEDVPFDSGEAVGFLYANSDDFRKRPVRVGVVNDFEEAVFDGA